MAGARSARIGDTSLSLAGQALARFCQRQGGGIADVHSEPADAPESVAGCIIDPDGMGAGEDPLVAQAGLSRCALIGKAGLIPAAERVVSIGNPGGVQF